MTYRSGETAISIENVNLGNRFFQYFAAHALARRLGDAVVANVDFRDWGVAAASVDKSSFRKTVSIQSWLDFDAVWFANHQKLEKPLHVLFEFHVQDHALYGTPDEFRSLFQYPQSSAKGFGDDFLVMNVRTGDILKGDCHWYPLLPVSFYKDIVAMTGLAPVFIGQLDDCAYVRQIKAEFPAATYVPSISPAVDFEIIRRSAFIVPAISTFSLAASWISSAKTIFLPLSGFLNPSHRRDIRLIPLDDSRYRLFLFPMNYALEEAKALSHDKSLRGSWREISHQKARELTQSLFVPRYRTVDGRPPLVSGFNERDYVHRNLDVAQAISDGRYYDCLHHYVTEGRLSGYGLPTMQKFASDFPNLALGAPASQSSVSVWSNGKTIETDAGLAVNGDRETVYAFHTEIEQDPWWRVDCQRHFLMKEIWLFPRKSEPFIQQRCLPLSVEASLDGNTWQPVAETSDVTDNIEDNVPIILRPDRDIMCRHVKLTVRDRTTCLYMSEIEVYGLPC